MRDALKGALGDRYEPTVEPYRQRIRESGPRYFELATQALKSIRDHAGEGKDGIIMCLTSALVDVCEEKDRKDSTGGRG